MKSKSRLCLFLVILFAGLFACSCFLFSACESGEVEDGGDGDDEGEIYLVSISVDAREAQTDFFVDDEFSSEGLAVTAMYSDDSSKIVTDYTVDETSYDMTAEGKYAVKVTYIENDITVYDTYEITVSAVYFLRVDFDKSKVKTQFFVGDEFSIDGLVAVAIYSDGSEIDVTDKVQVVSSYDMDTAGTYAIQVSYSEDGVTSSLTYNIYVYEATLSALILDTSAAKTEFCVGEEFTSDGLVVTASYNNESTKEVHGFTVDCSSFDSSKGGTYSIKVSYSEDGYTRYAEYTVTVIAKLTAISASGAKAEFYVGEGFSTEGLVVTATYEDETERVVSGYTVDDSVFDGDTLGDYAIVVTYIENGVTATTSYMVTVKLSYELAFTLNGDGYEVSGISGTYSDVVIPSEYNGLPVTSIADKAFQSCFSLTAIVIPDSVINIGERAFYRCTALKSLTIGEGVETVGNYAFCNCTSLTEVYFNAVCMGDLSMANEVFAYAGQNGNGITVIIGASVMSIPACLFFSGSHETAFSYTWYPYVTSLVFENESICESIGAHAFQACSMLESVIIGENVTTIGDYAFFYCDALTALIIPDSVVNIGERAFCNCDSLTTLTIGEGVKTMGYYAFANCTALTKINFNAVCMNDLSDVVFFSVGIYGDGIDVTIGANVKSVPAYLFNIGIYSNTATTYSSYIISVVFEGDDNKCKSIGCGAFEYCVYLSSVTIGNNVTAIGDRAFYNCISLTSVIIPDSVVSIGDNAFTYCSSLSSVTIGNNVKSIGYQAFINCTSLTSIIIPESVEIIGHGAFERCTALTEIYYNAANVDDLSIDNLIFAEAGHDGDGIKVTIGANVERIPACLFFSGEIENTPSYSWSPYITSVVFEDGSICKSIGAQAFQACSSLESVIVGDGVKSIGEKAFYYCTSLTNIIIGKNVNCIGDSAFYYCTSLTNVTFGESVKILEKHAFYHCGALTSIIIPNSVVYIEESAFELCTSLTSIIIPGGVTSIGEYAFYGCSSLLSVTISSGVINIGKGAFTYCFSLIDLTIGESVTTIGDYAFYACLNLVSVIIPDSVTEIGEAAFYSCTSMTSLTIGEGVKTMGIYAFAYCSALTSIIIPDSVTEIGDCAFYGCTSSSILTIGEGVKTVGRGAFAFCTALTEINFNATKTDDLSVDNDVFYNAGIYGEGIIVTIGANVESIPACLFFSGESEATVLYTWYPYITSLVFEEGSKCESIGAHAFQACSSLECVIIGENVTAIGDYAFFYCISMTSVTFGENVTTIGERAFYHCTSLTNIIIGENVTTIGEYAFCFCTSLTSIIIGENVTTIGEYAFGYCTSLTSVIIGENVTTIGEYAFGYCTSLTSVIIGENVTTIGEYAFYDCTSLTSIIIGENVSTIGEWAFVLCSSLSEIYYLGTEDGWNQIAIGDYNFSLTSATRYYYSEYTPTEDGNWWHYDEDGKAIIWQ